MDPAAEAFGELLQLNVPPVYLALPVDGLAVVEKTGHCQLALGQLQQQAVDLECFGGRVGS